MENPILRTQVTKLNIISSVLTAFVRRKIMLRDTTQSLLSHVQAFEENCFVRSITVQMVGILGNMMASNFWAASSKVCYVYYVRNVKIAMKHQGILLLLLLILENFTPVARTTDIMHFADLISIISFKKNILLMLQAALKVVKYSQEAAVFKKMRSTGTRRLCWIHWTLVTWRSAEKRL